MPTVDTPVGKFNSGLVGHTILHIAMNTNTMNTMSTNNLCGNQLRQSPDVLRAAVRALARSGFTSVNNVDCWGCTALHYLCRSAPHFCSLNGGTVDITPAAIEALVEVGFDAFDIANNSYDTYYGGLIETAGLTALDELLHVYKKQPARDRANAAGASLEAVMRALQRSGFTAVNHVSLSETCDNTTALHRVCRAWERHGCTATETGMQILVLKEMGFNLTGATDSFGGTPLHYLAKGPAFGPSVVPALKEIGFTAEQACAVDRKGCTALHYLAQGTTLSTSTLEALKEIGFSGPAANVVDSAGFTALHHLCAAAKMRMVEDCRFDSARWTSGRARRQATIFAHDLPFCGKTVASMCELGFKGGSHAGSVGDYEIWEMLLPLINGESKESLLCFDTRWALELLLALKQARLKPVCEVAGFDVEAGTSAHGPFAGWGMLTYIYSKLPDAPLRKLSKVAIQWSRDNNVREQAGISVVTTQGEDGHIYEECKKESKELLKTAPVDGVWSKPTRSLFRAAAHANLETCAAAIQRGMGPIREVIQQKGTPVCGLDGALHVALNRIVQQQGEPQQPGAGLSTSSPSSPASPAVPAVPISVQVSPPHSGSIVVHSPVATVFDPPHGGNSTTAPLLLQTEPEHDLDLDFLTDADRQLRQGCEVAALLLEAGAEGTSLIYEPLRRGGYSLPLLLSLP